MKAVVAAIYTRVSSTEQASTHTVASQVAVLCERAEADGYSIPSDRQFVDDGISGATLIRPALEKLRDLIAVGPSTGSSITVL